MSLSIVGVGAAEPMPMAPGGRPWHLGWLAPPGPETLAAFVAGMHDKGWVRDEHYTIDVRASNDARQFVKLADELVALEPDVLLGIETTSRVLQQRTSTIPIVMIISIDPVGAGLIQSLARPGTNVTGMSGQYEGLVAKWIEALVEIVPSTQRVAFLGDPGWSDSLRRREVVHQAAQAKGIALEMVEIGADAHSLRSAFDALDRRRPDGLVIPIQGGTLAHAPAIQEAVRRLRLPAVGLLRAGGLVQIGPDFRATARECADFVDRILRGAHPADLPVRQATSYRVTLNARLAREIGVVLPLSLRVRADEVIE
ncbi:MAG: ABC transporter substrate-binding protein [Burkholderiaceae bacterium]|nr:ABC transporter substrate-binding protein [Burkholderiaceae bacterium]